MTLEQRLDMLQEIATEFRQSGKLIHPSDLVTIARNFYLHGYDKGYDDAFVDREIYKGY